MGTYVHVGEKRVIPGHEQGEYGVGIYMTVTLSCDHRVVDGEYTSQTLDLCAGFILNAVQSCNGDCGLSGHCHVVAGAVGAQWLAAFKGYIEDPVTLIL